MSKSVLPKVAKPTRKTSTQAAALKAQPDADKTLSLILSRLEDMKAEETVTIDGDTELGEAVVANLAVTF